MKYILSLIALTVCSFVFSQTDGEILYLDLKKAVKNPASIEYLYLDCVTDNCEKAFEDISQYRNLKRIYISNFDGKSMGKNIENLTRLESITIEKSPNLNLPRLFTSLGNIQALTELSIKDNNLIRIPAKISLLSSLKSINISSNNNLDLEKTIDRIAELKNLEAVYLPINSITELPNNIGQLINLKTLDISNNYLESLPDGIGELRSLEELSIEGNLIQTPSSSLEKVKSINLKYVSLDDELTEEERRRLTQLFPNTKIKEIDPEATIEEQIENDLSNSTDTVRNDILEIKADSPISEENNNIVFGNLNVEKKGLKIYSQAYAHYAKVFQIKRFSNFDSTIFEERFLDTSYANINKVQYINSTPRTYEKIRLDKNSDSEKGEIWFNFSTASMSTLRSKNPELNAFIGMSWVYAGNLSIKEFKKKFYSSRGHKWYNPKTWGYWNKWKFWTDVRLTYNSNEQNFTIQLKDLAGFEKIKAYPRYNSLNQNIGDAQKTYVKRYSRYSRMLDSRKRRFERNNQRDNNKFKKSAIISENKKWASFQKNYMTEEERELSKDEWLIYYDKVIANERKALGNSAANIENIDRSIILDGYTKTILWQDDRNQENNAPTIQSIKTLYQDQDSNMLAVKKVLVLDKDTKTYQRYEGSLGIKMIRLNLIEGGNKIIITQLRNDDIGYVTNNEYRAIPFSKNNEYKFTLKKISAKFGSVQTVREELNF